MKTIVTAFCLSTFALTGVVATPTTTQAGPVGGGKTQVVTLRGGYIDKWTLTLRGDEVTRIKVKGDKRTRLELRVYDEFGKLLVSDTLGQTDDREVVVRPSKTGKFKIQISNVGWVPNTYALSVD